MIGASKPWFERVLEIAIGAAGIAVIALTLGNCVQAFIFPLEIEIREGTSWLHVMAMTAGVSLYDQGRVAFVNMNHGPMDPLLKYAMHRLLPFLTPSMVTRFFVPLLPCGILAAMLRALKGNWLPAILGSGCIYLFVLGLLPFHFLIGRSDPAAAFFLALLLVAGEWAAARPGRRVLRFFIVGLLASTVILTNWRFFAFAGGCSIAFAAEAVWPEPGNTRTKLRSWARLLCPLLAGVFLPFLTILLTIFHGDFRLYFVHFFGFFIPDGGIGIAQDIPYSFFPPELFGARWPVEAALLVGVGVALAVPAREIPRKLQLLVWLPVLVALWFSTTYAFFINHAGGGLYYFGPFYIVLSVHVARSVDWGRIRPGWIRPGLFALALAGLPWQATWSQILLFHQAMKPARTFLAEVHRLTRGARVQSEDVYFFENHYSGEVVDNGESVSRIYPTGYYGEDFGATAQRYFTDLPIHPPRFVMAVGARPGSISVISPVLLDLVIRRYALILSAPAHLWPNQGGAEDLYELKAAMPATTSQP